MNSLMFISILILAFVCGFYICPNKQKYRSNYKHHTFLD